MQAIWSSYLLILVSTIPTNSDASSSYNLQYETDPENPCSKVYECLDCHRGRLCLPTSHGLYQVAVKNCSAIPWARYCNPKGGCTKTPSSDCEETHEFVCPTVDGVYPDPTDCSKFHVCNEGSAVTTQCPKFYVYDHSLGECKSRRRSSDCVIFKCGWKNGAKVVYPKDEKIWAVCENGVARIQGKCEANERFDLREERCVADCRVVGNHSHPSDCQKYVRCARVGKRRYIATVHRCACNEGYDASAKRCTSTAPCLRDVKDECASVEVSTESNESQENKSSENGEDSSSTETNAITDSTDTANSGSESTDEGNNNVINEVGSENESSSEDPSTVSPTSDELGDEEETIPTAIPPASSETSDPSTPIPSTSQEIPNTTSASPSSSQDSSVNISEGSSNVEDNELSTESVAGSTELPNTTGEGASNSENNSIGSSTDSSNVENNETIEEASGNTESPETTSKGPSSSENNSTDSSADSSNVENNETTEEASGNTELPETTSEAADNTVANDSIINNSGNDNVDDQVSTGIAVNGS